MRIRLSVQRYGLPPTRILWSLQGFGPNQAAETENTTVAQLLEQVNEVTPLEAEDWGLEDYAVEVDGFECLHFSVLNHILKENDQVSIRPLQVTDRRIRRVSGRQQISADGRHLIDGVAFGRPFLRRAARPPIRIPSLKRPRLEDDQSGDDEEDTDETRLILQNGALYEEEYSGIQDDTAGGELNALFGVANGRRRSSRKRRRIGLGIDDLDRCNGDLDHGRGHDGGLLPRANGLENSRRSSRSSTKSVRFEDDNMETPATLLADEDSEDVEDDDFDPAAVADQSSSDKENAEPRLDGMNEETSDDATSSSGSSSSESEASTASQTSTTSSDTSDSAESDSDPVDEDSSESSEDTSSSSESPEPRPTAKAKPMLGKKPAKSFAPKPAQPLDGPKSKDGGSGSQTVPPNEGMLATKRRNERRRQRKACEQLKALGILPSTATVADYKRHMGLIPPDTQEQTVEDSKSEDVEAKKQALLDSLATSSPKVTKMDQGVNDATPAVDGAEPTMNVPTGVSKDAEVHNTTPASGSGSATGIHVVPGSGSGSEPTSATTQRRMRLDVAASRRFILNSLNLSGSRKKQGAEGRQSSNELAAPAEEANVAEKKPEEEPVGANAVDDSWMDRIDLKAVECCEDGVELSTPPFPFYQRWDPQQKLLGRSGRGKKQKRNRSSFYVDGYGGAFEGGWHQDEPEPAFDMNHDASSYPNDSQEMQAALDGQLLQDTNASTINKMQQEDLPDLPNLPADLSQCKDFQEVDAIPGAIIAFRHICLSQATNWSPSLSEYKTATVDSVSPDGTLELTLARRDADASEKRFDSQTGQRIYEKFEMPGYDNEEENDDGTLLSIRLEEMTAPKLLAAGKSVGDAANEDSDQESGPAQVPSQESWTETRLRRPPGLFQDESTTDTVRQQSNGEDQPSMESARSLVSARPDVAAASHVEGHRAEDIAEDDRNEYSLLIKQAGFRSEVDDHAIHPLSELRGDQADTAPEGFSVLPQEPHPLSYMELPGLAENPSSEQDPNLDDMFLEPALSERPHQLAGALTELSGSQGPPSPREVMPAQEKTSRQPEATKQKQPDIDMEDSTFLPDFRASDGDTRNDPDFSAPRRRGLTRNSRGYTASALNLENQPLSKRTRTGVVSSQRDAPPSKHKKQPASKSQPTTSPSTANASSDFDLPSPRVLLSTQPNPTPASTHSVQDALRQTPPASSPIVRGSKRKNFSKAISPPAVSAMQELALSDIFGTTESIDSPEPMPARNVNFQKAKRPGGKGDKGTSQISKGASERVVGLTISSDVAESSGNDEAESRELSDTGAKGLPNGPGWVRKSLGGDVKKATPVKRIRNSV